MDYPNPSAPKAAATVKPVTNNAATLEPVHGAQKVKQELIKGTWGDIKNHTIYDLLIPGIKRLALDAVSLLLFKTPANRPYGQNGTYTAWNGYNQWNYSSGTSQYVDYTGYHSPLSSTMPKAVGTAPSMSSSMAFNYQDPRFPTEGDAQMLKEACESWFLEAPALTCARFYEMAGIQCPAPTANSYGWRETAPGSVMSRVKIVSSPNPDGSIGYVVKMPQVVALRPNEIL